jgi:peptidoglycan hydrolase-like protein with peptidoglycan-binding domain
VLEWSGARLSPDPVALARVELDPLAGRLDAVHVFGPGGRPIPVAVAGGTLTPKVHLTAGERITVRVAVRRPGWLAWALGKERHETLVITAPAAHLADRWVTVAPGAPVRVQLDHPVSRIAFGDPGHLESHTLAHPRATFVLGHHGAAGSMRVATAARSWERLGSPERVTWFPAGHATSVVTLPATGAEISPATHLHLTFSRPVSDVLGSAKPALAPHVSGHWTQTDSHTLVFVPSGFGAGFGTHVRVTLPHTAAVASAGGPVKTTRTLEWTIPPGSTMRLQQLLAEQGYLPLDFTEDHRIARTPGQQMLAAVKAPAGHFSWRWSNVPGELRAMWHAGEANNIQRGAIMAFQRDHDLTADGFAGQQVWHALLVDALKGKRTHAPYSYVYVHRDSRPQSATLWSNGRTIISTPANTGVPGAPTELGTFPVFEHLAVTTMTGTNPDGSHYNDPGIKWVSYFNGGDALHAFNRASFGTPQSVGCVEMPEAAAAKIYPYTPIGTLVTVES